jgi:hypothetical protein
MAGSLERLKFEPTRRERGMSWAQRREPRSTALLPDRRSAEGGLAVAW